MRKLRNSELNRLSVDDFRSAEKLPIRVVLDDVRSLHNVGSVFRTCDAFRVSELILGGITPTPPSPEIEKTALGATETVKWQHITDISTYLKANKFGKLVALEQTTNSVSLANHIPSTEPFTLVFGNEVKGVNFKVLSICDDVFEIPQLGTKHSLNISVSAGIALWVFAQKYFK